jgi:hypothetical protein
MATLRLLGCYGFVYGQELLKGGFEVVEVEGVGTVGFGMGGVVVDFEEDAVDACGYGGAGQDRDELGLAAGDSVGC